MLQGIHKQIGILPTIETKGHLIQVGWKMLGADFVPRSDDATLEQREGRFNAVRVDVSTRVLSRRVIDRLMLAHSSSGTITPELVGNHHVNVFADVFSDALC